MYEDKDVTIPASSPNTPEDPEDREARDRADYDLEPTRADDVTIGAEIGGVGGAVTGAVAGSVMGIAGAVTGAVIGGVLGAAGSAAAVAAVDKVDGDGPEPVTDRDDVDSDRDLNRDDTDPTCTVPIVPVNPTMGTAAGTPASGTLPPAIPPVMPDDRPVSVEPERDYNDNTAYDGGANSLLEEQRRRDAR